MKKVAIIAGASPGLGGSLCCRLLARGYAVAALGRGEALARVAAEVPGLSAHAADLADPEQVEAAFAGVERTHGPATAVIYNAARLELSSALDVSLEVFDACWRSNCRGAFVVSRRALPAMMAAGSGTLVFTGATASTRGSKLTAAFASSKFALRGLAQALAREYAPRGVHVAHVVLDGLIWSERTRARFGAAKAEACMQADEVADVYLNLIAQPRSTWTHELDLRPQGERF
jgi:NAD(P)-dependent dehydrogenase (short-subunit alcohol dehydrogenase family)